MCASVCMCVSVCLYVCECVCVTVLTKCVLDRSSLKRTFLFDVLLHFLDLNHFQNQWSMIL